MFDTVTTTESRVPGADYSRALRGWSDRVFAAVVFRSVGFFVGFALVGALVKLAS